ncbi:MAG: hypothetical protein ACYTBJ_01735 [Planctomycetota bacterium]|jgi:hypothetical protein
MTRKSARELVQEERVCQGWYVREDSNIGMYGLFLWDDPHMKIGKSTRVWEPLMRGLWSKQPLPGLPDIRPGEKVKVSIRIEERP